MKLISGFKILKKHKMQAFLMIILSGLLFSLFGSVLNSNNKQKNSNSLEKMCKFQQNLCNEKKFKFATLSSQTLDIYNKKIPQKFLYSYSNNSSDENNNSECKYKKATGLSNYPINVITENSDSDNILETYSSMTNEVANQFKIILFTLTLLAFIINVSVFLNMLRENDANFCIERLCGAQKIDIDLEAFIPVFLVLLSADLLGFLILITFNELTISYLYVQFLIGIILIFTCTIVHFYMKKIQLVHYIGGKE